MVHRCGHTLALPTGLGGLGGGQVELIPVVDS